MTPLASRQPGWRIHHYPCRAEALLSTKLLPSTSSVIPKITMFVLCRYAHSTQYLIDAWPLFSRIYRCLSQKFVLIPPKFPG